MVEGSLLKQLFSLDFILEVIFMSYSNLRADFAVGTIVPQLIAMDGKGGSASTYILIFSIIVPSVLVTAPIPSLLLDKVGLHWTWLIVALINQVYLGTIMIPNLGVQIITFIFYTCARSWLYSAHYAHIAELYVYAYLRLLIQISFGFKHYGVLVGVSSFVIGFIACANIGFNAIANSVLKGNYLILNIIFTATYVLMFGFPIYVFWRIRRAKYRVGAALNQENLKKSEQEPTKPADKDSQEANLSDNQETNSSDKQDTNLSDKKDNLSDIQEAPTNQELKNQEVNKTP